MSLLIVALVAFAAVHVIPAIPRARNYWKSLLGRAYGPVYGLASLLLLMACLWAYRTSETSPLYAVPNWGMTANFALTFAAFLFVGIFLFRGSWRNRIQYPMAVAVWLWAMGHLLANGDSRSVVFFAALALTAALHAFLASRLTMRAASEERSGHNLLSLLFGVALYGVMAQMHGAIIGVPVIDIAGFAK